MRPEGRAQSDGAGDDGAPLWSFVPLAEASPPPEPASEAVRRRWLGLLGRLFGGRRAHREPQAQARGEPWSEHERGQWLPSVDREAQCAALEARLGDGGRELVVGPPNGGLGELVAAIGRRRDWQVLPPPGPEALLKDPGAATAALAELDGRPAVLTGLEGMFVRTPAGLRAARELAALILARRAPTIAACSGWAWRYLSVAVDGGAVFPDPWCPEPLDGDRLGRWLQTASGLRACEPGQAWMLAPTDAASHGDRASFLARVAAAARGDPRVARAIWADALRRPGGNDGQSGAASGAGLWVAAWQDLQLPELVAPTRDELMLLQLVLLHDAVTEPALRALGPDGSVWHAASVARLAAHGVLECRQGRWRVSALAYPGVRSALAHHGFWLDTPPDGWSRG